MRQFEFHPELFETRAEVIDLLTEAGFVMWMDYADVELDHDRVGVEVRGIPEESASKDIFSHLSQHLSKFPISRRYMDDWNRLDTGWCVEFFKYPHD